MVIETARRWPEISEGVPAGRIVAAAEVNPPQARTDRAGVEDWGYGESVGRIGKLFHLGKRPLEILGELYDRLSIPALVQPVHGRDQVSVLVKIDVRLAKPVLHRHRIQPPIEV